MATNYVASVDGVLLRVGDRIVSLYKDGGVPDGADKDHVKFLVDRGLLVEGEESTAPVEDHSDSSSRRSTTDGSGQFDPSQYNVDEVNAYLAGVDEAERDRVLAAERAGQARKGILGD